MAQEPIREPVPAPVAEIRALVAQIRAKHGWNLKETADQVPVSRITLYNWIKGKEKPLPANFQRLRALANTVGEKDETRDLKPFVDAYKKLEAVFNRTQGQGEDWAIVKRMLAWLSKDREGES